MNPHESTSGTSRQIQGRPRTLAGAPEVETLHDAVARAYRLRESVGKGRKEPGIPFGAVRLPDRFAPYHWFVEGSTGSGKSMLLQLLLQYVLWRRHDRDTSICIYDGDLNTMPILAALRVDMDDICFLSPLDARNWAWDIAKDVRTGTLANELTHTLVEDARAGEPFWPDSARILIETAMQVLNELRPGRWTFRDVLLAVSSQEDMQTLFAKTADGRRTLDQFFRHDDKTLQSIRMTIATKFNDHRAVAALWSRVPSKRRISLSDWLESDKILVLPNHKFCRPFVRVIYNRLSELIVNDLPDSQTRQIWFFLDEATMLGRIDGLPELLRRGRSKGVCVVLGILSVADLASPSAYGAEDAKLILGQCKHKAFLQTDDPDTAQWRSSCIGQALLEEETTSESYGPGPGSSYSINRSRVVRDVLLPSEFLASRMPIPTKEDGVRGVYTSSALGATWRAVIPGTYLEQHVKRPKEGVPAIAKRPDEEQQLMPWTEQERDRLGLLTEGSAPEPIRRLKRRQMQH